MMTIEEHFVAMIVLEAMIFLLGIWIVYHGQKKQTDLIEAIVYNPDYAGAVAENMVFRFMDSLEKDEVKKEIFYKFCGSMALNAAENVRVYYEKLPGDMKAKAMKGMPKPFKAIINGAEALGIDLGGIIRGKTAAKTAEAVEQAPVWGQ